MVPPTVNDLDYVVARLHGRRSRLAEADRLDALGRCRTIAELARTVLPGETIETARQFQRRLVEQLASEVADLARQLTDRQAHLLEWMLARFYVENLKVALRGILTGQITHPHLLDIPGDVPAAETLPVFVAQLPAGAIRESLQDYRGPTQPFFVEAALDRGYYRELLARAAGLAEAAPLIREEVDVYQRMLLSRGRYQYGLSAEQLQTLRITDIEMPEDEVVEAREWSRYLRSANRLFRRSHIGFGVVVAYVALRRNEVANLITLSERIRLHV